MKFLYVAVCFLVIGFTIYFPGIDAPRYGDDFTIVPESSSAVYVKIWTSIYQRYLFYRPVEDTITTFFIRTFGWNTLPTHILFILLHCSIAVFVYYIMLKLKFTHSSALFGSLFMLAAQGNVTTVGGNDTLGQLLSSSLCLLSLWLIYNAVKGNNRKMNPKLYALAMFLFTVSLLCKESSAVFMPLMFILLLIKNFNAGLFNNLKRSLILSLPFIVIFIIFFFIRSGIVTYKPSFGTGTYDFNIGLNIPKNIGMLLFSIFLPVSSVRVYEAIQLKDYKFLSIALFLTVTFAGIVFYGVWKSKKFKEAAVLICFIIGGFFPYALLNHVNEQYSFFSMPFASMLIGIGLGYVYDNSNGTKKKLFIGILTVFMIINSLSVMEKNSHIKELGERANMLFRQIENYLVSVEPNGALVLVNPPDKGIRFSAFRQPYFETMRYTDFMMYKLAGRDNFKFTVIEWDEIGKWKKPGVLMLKLEGDKVVRMD